MRRMIKTDKNKPASEGVLMVKCLKFYMCSSLKNQFQSKHCLSMYAHNIEILILNKNGGNEIIY